MIKTSIELFKAVVAEPLGRLHLSDAVHGFVTDFIPTPAQVKVLREMFQPVPIITLFSVEERERSSPEAILTKQLLHYFEVYSLETPGLFRLEVSRGQMATLNFIKAVTIAELTQLVHDLIYANRPIADTAAVAGLIRDYHIPYDINQVRNNELRVVLFDPCTDRFTSGDDAARYICYHATQSPLLIKSKEVIKAVQKNPVGERFLSEHILPLARVFNRHERLIMACKQQGSSSVVNRISKLSKKRHIPLHEPLAKRFIATALRGPTPLMDDLVQVISLRDKFKYLNLIEYKLLGLPYDTFIIRNGKVWTEADRAIADGRRLMEIRLAVLNSITGALAPLHDSRILLDPLVDYGLPISRKQTLGNLPYGTRVVATGGERLSAGIYWENQPYTDGYDERSSSVDLDLSAIDDEGNRTGWGQWSGYSREATIVFSGDVTSAPHGASEFMVVDLKRRNRYGLMVNIFRGPEPCPAEIVVGYPTGARRDAVWQGTTLLREKITLQSKQSIIGFLKDNTFVVYSGRLSSSRISIGKHPVIDKALGTLWTVGDVLRCCGIDHDTIPRPGVTYHHDLRYQGFTLSKLEGLFGI